MLSCDIIEPFVRGIWNWILRPKILRPRDSKRIQNKYNIEEATVTFVPNKDSCFIQAIILYRLLYVTEINQPLICIFVMKKINIQESCMKLKKLN